MTLIFHLVDFVYALKIFELCELKNDLYKPDREEIERER